MDLFKDTQDLVTSSGLSLPHIAKQTGLGHRWLHKFVRGEFKDVGVRRIQKLRNYLLDHRKSAA